MSVFLENGPLRVGAARVKIELPAEFFPTEDFIGVHDGLHARALILEKGQRLALVSLELTSLPAELIAALQQAVAEATNFSPENVMVCVTHTFSAPHFTPEHLCKTEVEHQKNSLLLQAIKDAVLQAVSSAFGQMKPAHLGFGTGLCDVNVNRDIPTPEGWWLGSNENGPTDKSVPILRFETLQGEPLALLFSYAVQSSVMDGSQLAGGGRLVSADLAGAACCFIEQEYGQAVPAIFCIGAAGDQAPALKARSAYAGKDGRIRVSDLHEQGFVLAEAQGKRLGAEVLRIAESITCQTVLGPISRETFTVRVQGQKMMDFRALRPLKQYEFVSVEPREEPVEIIRLGDVALVGVRPELSCQTGIRLRNRSSIPNTIILTMVNGGAKYMPERGAYERITYEAMNSPFACSAAEQLSRQVLNLLKARQP
jgi:neutral ceramidase